MFTLYKMDGTRLRLPGGVKALDVEIPPIKKRRAVEEVPGVPGVIDYGHEPGQRDPLTLSFFFRADSPRHFRGLRSEMYSLLSEPFYLIEEYAPGVQYLLLVSDPAPLERFENSRTAGVYSVQAEMYRLPFGESIEEEQAVGLTVQNRGDYDILPFHQDLRFVITEVAGSTDFLQIKNKTNGSIFRVNEGIGSGTRIEIDGPEVKINGAQALRRTDRTFLYLSRGKNELELTGATSARLVTHYRNYYD